MLGEPILEMYMMIVAPLLGCDESQYWNLCGLASGMS
jgi:hypothetical protein